MELLATILNSTVAFIVILSVIVFIHEFGHYYIAKISGVKIEVFSIGFGKELFGWNDKSGTRWKVSLLPLGGYVKMFGDIDPASSPDSKKIKAFTEEEKKLAFHTKSLPIKSAIVAAGPMANFLLAIVIMVFFFSYYGKPMTTAEVSQVVEGGAAEEAGLLPGDVIIEIDGDEIDSFADIQRIVAINMGTPIEIIIERDNSQLTTIATPKMQERKDMFGNDIKAAMLGIVSTEFAYEKLPILTSFKAAVAETYNISASTLKALKQMVTGERSPKEISGPLGIAKYSGQSAEKGIETVLWFMVVLSINLGLINLFPVPLLDGGHLMFYAVEAVQGKPVADRVQEWAFKIGIALVGSLFIFAMLNDLQKFNLF